MTPRAWRRSSKTASTKATKAAPIDDFVQYTVAMDVKAYHNAYVQLTDIRNCYVKVRDALTPRTSRRHGPRGVA